MRGQSRSLKESSLPSLHFFLLFFCVLCLLCVREEEDHDNVSLSFFMVLLEQRR